MTAKPVFPNRPPLHQRTPREAPAVKRFNQLVDDLVEKEMSSFKASVADLSGVTESGSELKMGFTAKSPPGSIISLVFTENSLIADAAQPAITFKTLNYDLSTGKPLALVDLFRPKAPYLGSLASYCRNELVQKGTLQFAEGALPTTENYQLWALTADGVELTFADYQVAPHPVGPQVVLVPFDQLRTVLDPQGPASRVKPSRAGAGILQGP